MNLLDPFPNYYFFEKIGKVCEWNLLTEEQKLKTISLLETILINMFPSNHLEVAVMQLSRTMDEPPLITSKPLPCLKWVKTKV
jgi:hypothetical protein